jgi:hypothetical protein
MALHFGRTALGKLLMRVAIPQASIKSTTATIPQAYVPSHGPALDRSLTNQASTPCAAHRSFLQGDGQITQFATIYPQPLPPLHYRLRYPSKRLREPHRHRPEQCLVNIDTCRWTFAQCSSSHCNHKNKY